MNQIALGIDPGIANTGYSIVARTTGKFCVLESGCIQTKASEPTPHRLNTIFRGISEVVYRYQIDLEIISIENVFYGKNVSSAMKTASVIGILQLLGEQAQIPSVLLTPQQVKSAIGVSTADKRMMKRGVEGLTGEVLTNHHTVDAIAAGISGMLQSRPFVIWRSLSK